MRIMFTRDLQTLVPVQGHQLQQWGQTLHSAQQHHHMSCRTQHTSQEEALHLAQALYYPFGKDEELARVLGKPEEVVAPAGYRGDVIAADPGL